MEIRKAGLYFGCNNRLESAEKRVTECHSTERLRSRWRTLTAATAHQLSCTIALTSTEMTANQIAIPAPHTNIASIASPRRRRTLGWRSFLLTG
jgi:hypothetical protein